MPCIECLKVYILKLKSGHYQYIIMLISYFTGALLGEQSKDSTIGSLKSP